MSRDKKITLISAIIYCLIGNIVGYLMLKSVLPTNTLLFDLFIPYTMTWFLSAMAGADILTVVFELVSFAISLIIFYPIGLYFTRNDKAL